MAYAKVNTVYTLCQNILAKDERGLFTPQEFNSYASDAQLRVVNDIIDGGNTAILFKNQYLASSEGLFSRMANLKSKIRTLLRKNVALTLDSGSTFSLPNDFMIMEGENSLKYNGKVVSIIDGDDAPYYINSWTCPPSLNNAVAEMSYDSVTVYPTTVISGLSMSYYKIPQGSTTSGVPTQQFPVWGYTDVGNKQIYNPTNSVDFELPYQLEHRLAIQILQSAGVSLRQLEVYQVADKEAQESLINENN